MKSEEPKPVSFHYMRHPPTTPGTFGHSAYMVAVSDEALIALNRDHPARWLTMRFNAVAKPHLRIQALADALRELDAAQMVHDDAGWLTRLVRRALRSHYLIACASGLVAGFILGAAVVAVLR